MLSVHPLYPLQTDLTGEINDLKTVIQVDKSCQLPKELFRQFSLFLIMFE